MKKEMVLGIIIGALVSGISVYAGISLSSEKIGYKDTTVKDSLDNLFTESVNGKISIVNSLSSNGLDLNNSSTYSEIVDGISDIFNDINNGKNLIAEAVTNKGISTSSDASFETMANNIKNITATDSRLNVSGNIVQIQLKDGSWWTVSNTGLPATFTGQIAAYSESNYNDSVHSLAAPSSTHQLYSQYLSYSNGTFTVLKNCYLTLNMSARQVSDSQGKATGIIYVNGNSVRSYILGNSRGDTSGTYYAGSFSAGSTFSFYNANTSGYPSSSYSIVLTVS